MIYLNNAGTSWPKPKAVHDAVQDFYQVKPESWNEIFYDGINTICDFFNIYNHDRFLFTSGCTSALSTVFTDLDWQKGDRILISSMEHHALSRWFHKLSNEKGVEGVVIPRGKEDVIDLNFLEDQLKKGAKWVAVTMASNMTGEILPFQEIVKLSHQYGTKCLLDGAQVAGLLPIDIEKIDPDIFVFAGHKGLLGPQGIGGLYIKEGISMVCPSAVCEIEPGKKMVGNMPSYCDVGSLNMAGLAGLVAGIKWLKEKGLKEIEQERIKLTQFLWDALGKSEYIVRYGKFNPILHTGAIAFNLKGIPSADLANLLKEEYQIKIGSGFMCAPMAHETMGTQETGCLRASVGPFSSKAELETTLTALQAIAP